MNFKLTLTLVILLLLIAIGLYFIPAGKPPVKDENTANALLSPKPAGVKAITYSRGGEKQLAFDRTDKGWQIAFPMTGKAQYEVDSIADAMVALAYKEKFQPEPTGNHSAATTGTDHPHAQIAFTADDGTQHTLDLGKRTVGGVYATLDGGKTIYLLDHDPEDSLDKPAQDFRDKDLQTVATDKITELTISRPDAAPVVLQKTGDKWLVIKPVNARANLPKITDILNALKIIHADAFPQLPKNSTATGLNPPVLTLTAMVSEPAPTPPTTGPATATKPAPKLTPITLEMGYPTTLTDKKDVYAALGASQEVFTLPTDSFDKFNQKLSDRDPAITPAMVGSATEATVTTNGKPVIKLAKNDNAWSIESTSPPVKGGDLQVGDWLGDIANLRAIKFLDNPGDLKSIGLEPPLSRIELTVPGQSQHEVILIGKPETEAEGGKVTPMMRQGEPTVYLVQTADADKAIPTALALRDRTVERLTADHIRSINISGSAANGGGLELDRQGAAWNVKSKDTTGKSVKADDVKITSLLAEFTPLTAAKYLSEKADVPAGTPDITVTLHLMEPIAATQPATQPSSRPATQPAAPAPMGPELSKPVDRTLKLYKTTLDKQTQWKALWAGGSGPGPQWTFEPTPALIDLLTKDTYIPAPATQPK